MLSNSKISGNISSSQLKNSSLPIWLQELNQWCKSPKNTQESRELAVKEILALKDKMHIWKGKNIAFTLDLTSLSLTELPPVTVWKELQGMTAIFLDNNCFSGEELLKLNPITSLEEINLDDNAQLNIIPDEIISKQTSLTTFAARNCNLSFFPSGLFNCPQLSDIILSKNNIACIPEPFGSHMDNLRNFEISDNNLTQLPSDMGYLHNLKTIDLKGNSLYELSPLDGLVDVLIDI